jgi:hypothetical protein
MTHLTVVALSEQVRLTKDSITSRKGSCRWSTVVQVPESAATDLRGGAVKAHPIVAGLINGPQEVAWEALPPRDLE